MNVVGRKIAIGTMALATSLGGHAQEAKQLTTRADSVMHAVQQAVAKTDSVSASTISWDAAQRLAKKAVPNGMVEVTKRQGTFVGKYKDGKLDGDLAYRVQSKMIADPAKESKKIKLGYGAQLIASENLPSNTGGFTATASRGGTQVDLGAAFGREADRKDFVLRGALSHNFKVADGLTVGPEVAISGDAMKVGKNHCGRIVPEMNAVARYNHQFDNGMYIEGEAAGGGALNFYNFDNSVARVKSNELVGRLGVGAGYKNVGIKVTGGHDAIAGNNVTVGAKINLK